MDDIEVFQKYWRPVALGGVAAILLSFGFTQYEAGQSESLAETSVLYEKVLESVDSEDLESTITQVTPGLEGTTYGSLTHLIKASSLISDSDYEGALAVLNTEQAGRFAKIESVSLPSVDVNPKGLVLELEALLVARASLGTNVEEARKILRGLVLGADFINLEALTVLANSGAAKEEVQKVAEELSGARPGLADAVKALGL